MYAMDLKKLYAGVRRRCPTGRASLICRLFLDPGLYSVFILLDRAIPIAAEILEEAWVV